jgi:hypothetical protein
MNSIDVRTWILLGNVIVLAFIGLEAWFFRQASFCIARPCFGPTQMVRNVLYRERGPATNLAQRPLDQMRIAVGASNVYRTDLGSGGVMKYSRGNCA